MCHRTRNPNVWQNSPYILLFSVVGMQAVFEQIENSQELASGILRCARDNLRFPRFASGEFALSAAFHVFLGEF